MLHSCDSLFKTQTTEGQYVSATSVIKWAMSWNYQTNRTITSRGRKVRQGGVPKHTETISVSTSHYLALKCACIYVHTDTHSSYSFSLIYEWLLEWLILRIVFAYCIIPFSVVDESLMLTDLFFFVVCFCYLEAIQISF